MGPLLGVILLFVFGVAAVVYFTRIGSSILYPTLVNCWYCNNNVFLPPNGLDNVERWKCPICESLNVRNKVQTTHRVYGLPVPCIDSSLEMLIGWRYRWFYTWDVRSYSQSTKYASSLDFLCSLMSETLKFHFVLLLGRVSRRPSASKIINALCSNCDLAQQRILSYVTAFDPDNNVSVVIYRFSERILYLNLLKLSFSRTRVTFNMQMLSRGSSRRDIPFVQHAVLKLTVSLTNEMQLQNH